MKHRRISQVLASTVVLLAISGTTVVHADDEVPDTTPTTQEAPPSTPRPTVSITVEDVPESTSAPTTDAPPTTEREEAPETGTSTGTTTTTVAKEEDAPTSGTTTTTVAAAAAEVTTTTHNPVQITADQEAIVTGTQVANGNTGGNLTNNDTPSNGSAPPNSIGTGTADAVGSDDTNIVNQAADVVLTEQALANILQVALIINVGAALANSGANGVNATPGGTGAAGSIGTGDANAVGLDMGQYITQAARAEGDANTDDAAKQLAVSLWMGIGLANSGTNAITGEGATGSGGAVDSGNASATGNHSLTDILQGAAVNGSGTSETNIEQYATVMNLGFALANSGANDIAGVAGGLLTAGSSQEQNDMAVDLFSMLLPALMSTYASSAGAGTIGTGNATAVGNDSETYVKQLAMAANSGDGIASIIQSVLVANVGAAGANTGGNALGGSYASLSPDAAKAVVTLAAFLSQMLAMVHMQAYDQALTAQSQGLEIPFGDIVLQVQGAMQGVDSVLTNETGARANIRQVTIVLSLGFAQANSGLNAAIAENGDPATMALMQGNSFNATVNGDAADQIRTANAEGVNTGLVIICQRRNALDIACLAPPPPPVDDPDDPADPVTPTTVVPIPDPAAPQPIIRSTQEIVFTDPVNAPQTPSGFIQAPARRATDSSNGGGLPMTGADADSMLQVASWMTGAGGFAFIITRRRRRKV